MRIPTRAALGFLILACADPRRPGAEQARQRDSSGITIVENGPDAPTLLTVNLASARVIGANGIVFTSVAGAVLLSNRNILIADSTGLSVRLFDSTGRFVRTVVEKGEGPAQLNKITRIFATTLDSVYVVGSRAIVVIGPTGDVVRKIADFDIRPDSLRKKSTLRGVIGVLDDGSIVTEEVSYSVMATEDPKQVAAGSMPRGLVVFRRGIPGGEPLAQYAEQPGRRQLSQDRRPVMDGPTVALAAGNELFYSPGDTLGFHVSSPDGKLQRIARVARPRTPLPSGFQSYIPDVIGLARDDTGRLWVTSFFTRNRDALIPFWYVFSRDGTLEAEVRSEQPMFIVAVRGDRVLGVYNNTGHIQLALFTLNSTR